MAKSNPLPFERPASKLGLTLARWVAFYRCPSGNCGDSYDPEEWQAYLQCDYAAAQPPIDAQVKQLPVDNINGTALNFRV